jgi:hypothetical protein
MRTLRKAVIAALLLVLAAAFAVPTFAQDNGATATTRTITITQDQINQRLANLHTPRFSNVSVTLGEGQITVAFTFTPLRNLRNPGGLNNRTPLPNNSTPSNAQPFDANTSYSVSAIIVPAVQDGHLNWTLNSLTVNGQPATDQQKMRLTQFVRRFAGQFPLRNALRNRITVTNITVTNEAITITVERRVSI